MAGVAQVVRDKADIRFVHTWVPDECRRLMNENLTKNLADQDEYPAATEIHNRCIVSCHTLDTQPES